MNDGQVASADGQFRLRLVCTLVALAPAIMAVTTWTPSGYFSLPLYFWRFLAPPVIAIELITIALAWTAGFRPIATIAALPRGIAIGIATLAAIDLGTALFVAVERDQALMRSSMTLTHLLFGLAAGFLLTRYSFGAWRRLWWILATGGALYVALLVLYVASIANPLAFDWQHFGLGVVNIRHAGFYVAGAAALALGIAATEERPRLRWLATGMLVMCCAQFFWSGSRAPLISLLATSLLAVALIPAVRTLRLPVALGVGMIGGVLISLIHLPPNAPSYGLVRIARSQTAETADQMASGRLDLWLGGLRTAFQRPIFGHGESQYITIVPEAQGIYYHPHNLLIQLLVQWGGLGTLIFIALACMAWWRLFTGVRNTGVRSVPVFMAFNMFAIYAMFDGILYFVYPSMIVAFLLAAGLTSTRAERPGAR
jgi:O-antigen ligase